MHRFIFLCLILLFSSEGFSQDTILPLEGRLVRDDLDSDVVPIEFDQDKIEAYKKDEAFNYVELQQVENPWEQFKSWLNELWHRFWRWLFGDFEGNGFTAFLVRIIPYIIIIGVIVFVGWLFYKLNPGSHLLKSKDKPEVFFTEEEEIIKTKDIKKLIQKALDANDYRLAVRYYYLFILKKLSSAELISYEFDKTNNDYISEMSVTVTTSENIKNNFRKATNIYDYIWYGNFLVTETDFRKAQQTFTNLEHQIPKAVD
ncbi:DUF4129 domain-containing protein [Ulvibacter antarcticus]|uniref:DUF4129 domain-containing protein n=1 Tax=Ulvibacter antarcticus TaxID=442714 RepID=A0A3L9Z320_9FLAO|nr:DUF4129 domain-containing protein [Ulvibacter antarcticus]RMA64738.1 hypothetical protein BXY75_1619 [Ulvibacter antarcticus]